jgi:Putative peptidoglycan binding domain
MTPYSRLIITSAIAAALAAPAVLAQTGAAGSESGRGATGVNPSTNGQQPNPGRPMSDSNRSGNATGSGSSTGEIQRDATDVRPGGQAAPAERMNDPNRRGGTTSSGAGPTTTEIERNATELRPGGQTDAGTDPNQRGGINSPIRQGASPYGSGTVRDAQQALQAKGYDIGQPDGVMGPRTVTAVRDFQQQQGLPPSGRLDQATLSALNVNRSRN